MLRNIRMVFAGFVLCFVSICLWAEESIPPQVQTTQEQEPEEAKELSPIEDEISEGAAAAAKRALSDFRQKSVNLLNNNSTRAIVEGRAVKKEAARAGSIEGKVIDDQGVVEQENRAKIGEVPHSFQDKDNYYPEDIKKIKERGKLRIGMFYQDRIPFFMRDEADNLVGLDPDIGRGIAKELGVEAEFVRTQTYGDAVNCVITKKCDMAITKLSLTMSRAQKVLYTDRYVDAFKALLVNRLELQKLKKRGDETLNELVKTGHFILAVPRDSSYEDFARTIFPDAKLERYESFHNEAVPNLLKGKYTAIFSDELETHSVLQSLPGASFKLMVIKLTGQFDPLYMAVNAESHNLLQFVQRYMESENIAMDAQGALTNKKYERFIKEVLAREKNAWKEILSKFNIKTK